MWAVPTIALVVLGFAAVSRRVEGTSITGPIVFTGAGLIFGSSAIGLVDPNPSRSAVRLLAEATLAVVLFGDAARIDLRALREEFGVPARLLGIGLPLTIVLGALAALVVFGSMAWPEAALLAIVLAPTDAALGQEVVTLPTLPSRIRQGLNVEGGLNDGLCVPLFYTAIAIATSEAGLGAGTHVFDLLAKEIGYGALMGAAAGALSAGVVVVAASRGLVDPTWLQIVPAAGATLAYTMAAAVGGSGFIAAFVGGAVFGGVRRRVGGEVGYLLEQLGALLGAATFIVFGAVLLRPALGEVTWAAAAYAVLSLTVVRMAPVAVAMIGTGARPPTVAFLGWFGPRGLASIVFAILLLEDESALPSEPTILTTVVLTVGLSVLAHGVSAAPLARRYSDWAATHPQPDRLARRAAPAREIPWRLPLGRSK